MSNNSPSGPLRTRWDCKNCDSDLAIHTPPKPDKNGLITNAGGIRCADCGTFVRWLSASQAHQLGLGGGDQGVA